MMRHISETNGLKELAAIRDRFRREISEGYEHRAKCCEACPTPGACCLDEHFVNVRISRLEAAAIKQALSKLPDERQAAFNERIERSIENYGLGETEDTIENTYACPLYEKGVGCLVHATAKPLPCIAHACYEKKEDLPPDELLAEREVEINRLNVCVYGRSYPLLPLPVAIRS